MSRRSYAQRVSGFKVTETIEGAHPRHTKYPLLPGDLLIEQRDGTFVKWAPGLAVGGFTLTDEQRDSLGIYEEQPVGIGGMDYFLSDEDES